MNHVSQISALEQSTAAPFSRRYEGGNSTPHGSLFNSQAWHEVLWQTYGMKVETISENGSASIQLCEIEDARGSRVISLPFCDYCDPQLSNYADWEQLATQIIARGKPVKFKLVRNQIPLADSRFTQSKGEVWHGTDLTLPEAELWAHFDVKARGKIRKAERGGVTIRIGRSLEDIMAFYEMHVEVRRAKYQLLAQPVAFFEAVHRVFSQHDDLYVVLAEVGGAPIAGAVFLRHGDDLYYKFSASQQQGFRPTDLIIWSGMKLGKELGLKFLDFGISSCSQEGLVSYKRKYATIELPVTQLTWTPPGYSNPQGEKAGKLLSQLTSLLTEPDVPPHVARRASDILYGHFC